MPKHFNIPVFIAESGCPFQCVFCDQRKISGNTHIPSVSDVNEIVAKHLDTIDWQHNHVEIAFFGGSFTGLPLLEQEHYLKTATEFVHAGKVKSIRLSTRPDYINHEVISLLSQYPVSAVELGAQSFDDDVLRQSGRGHTAEQTRQASAMLKHAGFSLVLQMMTGLHGDTPEKSMDTASEIINLGAAATRIYPCVVIEGTKLARMYKNHEFSPQTLDEATNLAARLILKFEAADVKILRVGLHPSEELTSATSLIAGPFHPAFREMAESTIWKHLLEAGLNFSADKHLTIYTAANQTAKAAGYHGKNRKFLEQHFKSVGFKTDIALQNRAFYADYC